MAKRNRDEIEFEVGFFESVLRREKDYFEVMEILGAHYTFLGRVDDGLRMDKRIVKLRPDYSTGHYNLACSLALAGKKSEAMEALHAAIRLGYRDHKWMRQDKDLLSLQDDPGFQAMIEALQSRSTISDFEDED